MTSLKIPQAELDRLKREVSLLRLVESQGVKLSGSGDNLLGLCPWHNDKNPSLVVSPSKNIWNCLGACQKGGSVIDWVMLQHGVSFRLAVEMLKSQASSLAASSTTSTTQAMLEEIAGPEEPDNVVLRRVADYYHATLKESPNALDYLEARGLRHPEMIDHFRLGYANRTLGYRLPKKAVNAGASLRGQLQRLGIFRDSGHEHFCGSLVIPILGENGVVREMYGRKIKETLKKEIPRHLYLPSRPGGRGVFNLEALKASKEIILCEALIDALTFWCAGFRNVTTAYGVAGFTEEMRDALIEYGTEKVLIAYDRDDAGDGASEKLARELGKQGLEVFRVLFPRGMDANEYALKVKPAPKSLETALRSAQWMAGTRPVAVPDAVIESAELVGAGDVAAPKKEKRKSIAKVDHRKAELPREVVANDALEPKSAPLAEKDTTERNAGETIESTNAPKAEQLSPTATAGDVLKAKSEENAVAAIAGDMSKGTAVPETNSSSLAAVGAPASAPKLDVELRDEEVRIPLGDRRWRIRGLAKNTSYESLRVNVLVARGDDFFVDTLELYSARQRAAYLKQASLELSVDELVLKSDLGKIVLRLEDLVHQQIEKALKPIKMIEMSEEDRKEALVLLRDPHLLDRILEDFDRAGVVGEETNKLIGYLAAVSRKLEAPLAVVIQSSTAAGKSSLMDAVLRFVPEEERVQYSAMTGQSLFYMGETDLAHKILAIAEEQGAQSASYALKLLQSEGELTIASTGKDPATGKLVTQEYRVEGPVMIFLTTTAIEVDEELLNRCLILTVDEGVKQTSAIHERQREAQTLEGLLRRHDRDRLVALHQNAQRMIEPLFVANPFAKTLRFSSHTTRTRRDHMKYLTLIRAIALLHQHQREIKEVVHHGERIRYIEVTEADIAVADRLAKVAIGNCLDDLPPQTRSLLEQIERFVNARAQTDGIERSAVRFTRREIREHTRLGHSQLAIHMGRLEQLEYLLIHAGGGKRRAVYELAISNYEGKLSGGDDFFPGAFRPLSGGAPRKELSSHPEEKSDLSGLRGKELFPAASKNASYTNGRAEAR